MSKLRAYSTLQSFCDLLLAILEWVQRRVQNLRVWAWTRATKANMDGINERQVRRTKFC